MAEHSAEALLKQAIQATRQKNLPAARKLIQASIRKDANNATAWLVYASIAETKREKLLCLKKTLELDPDNTQALKMVTQMGVNPGQLTGTHPAVSPQQPPQEPEPDSTPEPAPSTAAPQPSLFSFQRDEDTPEEAEEDAAPFLTFTEEAVAPPPELAQDAEGTDSAGGEPVFESLPDTAQDDAMVGDEPPRPAPRPESFEERVTQSAQEAQQVITAYLTPPPNPDGIEWVKKERNRAGENEILLVRAAVATSLFTFIGVPLIVLSVIAWNTPLVQSIIRDDGPNILVRTLTPTPTPPTTPTNTPGFTPTPSITPTPIPENAGIPTITPTPTVLGILRAGNPDINFVQPTQISVPGVQERVVIEGIRLINEGNYAQVIPTMEVEREANVTTFDGLVYYTEAIAKARLGEIDEALELLQEGEQLRIERTREEDSTPLAAIRAGFATVYLEQGIQAQAAGNPGVAPGAYNQAQINAEEAVAAEPEWAVPHLLLIESHKRRENYTAALAAIDAAQTVDGLEDDVRFIVQRGEIYYLQEDYINAEYQAFVALYVDPVSAQAHDLQTRIALAQGQPSLASLYAQTYLYYHPLVVRGWEMLGMARQTEGSTNLALEAYTQAIIVGENTEQPPAVDAYLARAAIYEERGQLMLAYADVAAAADATDDPQLRRREMMLAFAAEDYTAARRLAGALGEDDTITPGEQDLMLARIQLAQAEEPSPEVYTEVATLIDGNFTSIPEEMRPLANTLRAEAYLRRTDPNPQVALNFAQEAVAAGETPRRRFLLGEIYAAQENYAAAIVEYERVLTLDQLVGAPDELVTQTMDNIGAARDGLLQQQADITATARAR